MTPTSHGYLPTQSAETRSVATGLGLVSGSQTSTSIALACLETVVHVTADQCLPLRRWLVAIDVPAELWQQRLSLEPIQLPGWDSTPAGRSSRRWGDRWLLGQGSLIALVPSVIVPEECNALINPAHPGASSLLPTVIRPWTYDSRLR